MSNNLNWYKVANVKDYQEGRVKTVTAGTKTIALSLFEGKFCAIDNHCPHQGGPLGEGSIEEGWLRCPWHGYEYHPCTGKPPEGLDDTVPTYEVKIEGDEIYVGVWETDLVNPNFSEYANNCGALGIRVTQKEELEEAMKKALDHNGSAMVEIISDSELI